MVSCEDLDYERTLEDALSTGFKGTLGKVYFLSALGAGVLLVKLVRKDFLFLFTIGTFTGKGYQILSLLKTRTMLWC